ncbi:hypothetical protein BGX38DRAFT_1333204 [Terfezia claveryi]|nr:hypothetical protein BGX38DRAFT_1333204 [Terfezia claveryi]
MNSREFLNNVRPTVWEYSEADRINSSLGRAYKKIPIQEFPAQDLKGPITPPEHAGQIADGCRMIEDSLRVSVGDKLVLVYWKNGLMMPYGSTIGGQMISSIESSIHHLAAAYPPPKPKPTDVRHHHYQQAVEKYGEDKCGVYHFARWVAQGQKGMKDPVLSRDILATGAKHNATHLFYRQIAPLIQATSLIFQTVDPEIHLHYLQEYKKAAENSPLHGWTTSRRACFQGIVLIRNLAAEPHKDCSDYADEQVLEEREEEEDSIGMWRIAITHAVARAWEWLHQEKQASIIKAFEQTGISLPPDGSQDHKLQIRGLPDFKITELDTMEEEDTLEFEIAATDIAATSETVDHATACGFK